MALSITKNEARRYTAVPSVKRVKQTPLMEKDTMRLNAEDSKIFFAENHTPANAALRKAFRRLRELTA